ncbi:MAG TPA: rod shape-determining protein MreC [Thermoleophilia bacterium]|nr:rod shape-determining protein MreC [Thermoleophilia bacterium]HQG03548.1 rod shape-determining protein MreC [Thermoleophilia bacterium]HQG54685.1 rod shape-determining protein MreC [Thermoleophilia bacterium]HQJ98066.1 rod shape-determining protein MreC [Thermoleophilia bacterium]
MNRRRVLQRRIVAVVLAVLAVGLLTLSFREGENGFVHRVRDGAVRIVAPLQEGSARVIEPFRDGWNWVADLFHAKSENKRLKEEVDALRAAVAEELTTQAENEELRALLEMRDDRIYPEGTEFVTARVIARSTTAWYSTVTINVGHDDGVQRFDAVVNGQGLVGRVQSVTATASQVQLLTDQQSYVDAIVVPSRAEGLAAGSVTGGMTLQYVDKSEAVRKGQFVVTSGRSGSIFVRGIPIGQVENVSSQEVELYQNITLRPAVDFRKLDIVMVVKR